MIGAFFLKHWTWVAMAALAGAVLFFSQMDAEHSADLKTRTAERDAATKSASDWSAAYQQAQALAATTATAHAKEIHDVAAVHSAAQTAKQGVANAPGADAAFTYSDAAYEFMRGAAPPVAAPAGPGAKAATIVDR